MWKNTHQGYGLLTIVLHWLMALLVMFLFGLGLYMVELNYYHEWYRTAPALHKSIGVFVFFLLLIRTLGRLMQIQPQTFVAHTRLQRLEACLAKWIHRLMYVLIASICISGYLISTADGRSVDIFDLWALPALPIQFDNQEDIAGDWHFYLALFLMLMVACHALAALKHHFIDRDEVLKKMLRSGLKKQ